MRPVAGAGLAGDVSVGVRLGRSARRRAVALDGATGWGEVPEWRGGGVARWRDLVRSEWLYRLKQITRYNAIIFNSLVRFDWTMEPEGVIELTISLFVLIVLVYVFAQIIFEIQGFLWAALFIFVMLAFVISQLKEEL